MVVGTMKEARALAKQLGMADLRWMKEGEFVQRAEFAEWPRSPQLELAIAASAAHEWVMPVVRSEELSGQVRFIHGIYDT